MGKEKNISQIVRQHIEKMFIINIWHSWMSLTGDHTLYSYIFLPHFTRIYESSLKEQAIYLKVKLSMIPKRIPSLPELRCHLTF